MANGLLTRDDIARIYNSDTPINNFGLTRDEIASIYNGPSAVDVPSQPIQAKAQEIPALKPTQAETKPVQTERDKKREEAKAFGRTARKLAEQGALKEREQAYSAPEQRDIDRAKKAQEEAEKREEVVSEETALDEKRMKREDEAFEKIADKKVKTKDSQKHISRNAVSMDEALSDNRPEVKMGTLDSRGMLSEEDQALADKLQKKIDNLSKTVSTGDVGVDEAANAQNKEEVDKLKRQLDSIYKTSNSSLDENAERFLDPNYKLSKYEEDYVDKVFDEYLENNQKAKELYNTQDAAMSSLLAQRFTPEEAEEYARMVTLKNKVDNVNSAGLHMTQSMPFVKGLADKSAEKYGEQKNIDMSDYDYSSQLAQTQKQNPLASTGGNMAYQIGSYAAFSPLVEGIPVVGKVADVAGKAFKNPAVGNAISNVIKGQAADTILDTLPNEIIPDIMEGNWKDLPKDIGISELANLGFNVLGEGAGAIAKNVIPSLGQVDEAVNKVEKNNIEAKLLPTDSVPKGAIIDRANQLTDDLTMAEHQIKAGVPGVKPFDKLIEKDARIKLDEKGKLTQILNKYPNIDRIYNGPSKSNEIIDNEINYLRQQADAYAHGAMDESELFDCGATPGILKKYGINGNKIMMSQGIYNKITLPDGYIKNPKLDQHFHGLNQDGVEKIVKGLNDPAVILPSDKDDAVLAIINYTSESGTPVLVPITIGKNGLIEGVNDISGSARIKSAHIRSRLDNYLTGKDKFGRERASRIQYIKGDDETLSNGFNYTALESPSPFTNNINQMDNSVKGGEVPAGEFTSPDAQKILDAYRAGERLSETDQYILEMALLEEKYSNLRKYSEEPVMVEKSEVPEDVLKEMIGDNYDNQLESVKLSAELAKRGYNLWENGFNNNIMQNYSVLQDAVAHHLAVDNIPASIMAEAYDITYQNGGSLDDAIKLAAEMSGTKLSNPTHAEGIMLRGNGPIEPPTMADEIPNVGKSVPETSNNLNPGSINGTPETVDTTPVVEDTINSQNLDNIPPENGNGNSVPPEPPANDDIYVKDPNAIANNQIEDFNGKKTRESKLGTNTMSKLDDEETNANDLSRGIYSYTPKDEQGTMRVAARRVKESPNKAYNEILSTSDDAFTAEDVDTSMMLRNQLKSDLARAKEEGNEQTINYIQSQLDALTIRQRKAASNAGQVSQAWAKWSRDADGAMFASYNIAARQYEDALKNNPKIGEIVDNIVENISDDINKLSSEELWDQLANADLSKESVDSLSERIQEIVKSVLDKESNAKVKRNFRDANIKKLSDTLAMELKQGEDISDTLEMMRQAGVTGFTGLDSSVEDEVRAIFDEAEKFGFNSRQRIELEDQAYAKLAQALNLTGGIYDKIDAVRYLAMLANPKTHLRNILGNYTFGEITNFKDQLAGVLEEAVDRANIKLGGEGIERTTAVIHKNGADRALHNAALDDFEENAARQLVGDKYGTAERGIEGNKNVFGYGKVGSKASNAVKSNAQILEAEDVISKRRKYADSLTRYLKANGYDESILKGDITDPKTLEFLDKARQHAIEEAEKATFNQKNVAAEAISKFSREARDISWSDATAGAKGKKLAGLFLDATVPFKRTPMNIVTTLWDYQPIHLARFGVDITDIAKHKPQAVNKLIDDMAKELTGVGMLGAGYALAKNGFIKGRANEETGDLDELTGKQDYSLNLGPLGSYTLDWLSPSLTIMLAGANLYQSGVTAEGLSQMLADIGEPVLETTMLSSLVDVLRSAQYAESPMDTVKQTVATAAKNYVTQFVPTELGNISRSIDNTRRSTYTDKTGVRGIADRALQSIENKIPLLSMTNEPYINKWGEEEQNLKGPFGESGIARFAYNHLSPGYYSPENTTPKDEYLYNLYDQLPQPDEEIFPQSFSNTIKVDGVNRKVTPQEKTIKDKAEGQAREAFVSAISQSDAIKALEPEKQAQIVKDAYKVAKLIGNASIIDGYESTDTGFNIYMNALNNNEDAVNAFLNHEIGSASLKVAGIDSKSNAAKAVQSLIDSGDQEGADQLINDISVLSDAGVSSASLGIYADRGITYLGDVSPEEYADLWNKINTSNATEKAKANIVQGELLDFFNSNPDVIKDQETAMRYWLGMITDYDDKTKVPYYDSKNKEWKTRNRTGNDINLINSLKNGEPIPQETAQIQEAPVKEETQPAYEPITTLDPQFQPTDISSVFNMMADNNINTSAAKGYWNYASANNSDLTPGDFYETFNAIDSALGQANGGLSKDEWVQYLNSNDKDYEDDLALIEMLYNPNWPALKYSNGKWTK